MYVGLLPFGYRKGPDGVPEIIDVHDMLANVFYVGSVKYKGQVLPSQHPALIPQDLFDAVATLRAHYARQPRSFSKSLRTYLLVSIIRCAFCGERMWAHSTRARSYYRDTAARRGLWCLDPGTWVRTDELDAQVDSRMRGLRLSTSWQAQVEEIVRADEEQAVVRKEAERLQEKPQRLNEQYRDIAIIKVEDEYHRRRLEIQIAALPVPQATGQRIGVRNFRTAAQSGRRLRSRSVLSWCVWSSRPSTWIRQRRRSLPTGPGRRTGSCSG